MPVRLDPFQNIVGVNWGGRLAALCDIFVTFGTTATPVQDRDKWSLVVILLTPEVSGQLGLIDAEESFSGLDSIFNGASYQVQFMGFQEGSGAFQPDRRLGTFKNCVVIPNDISGGVPETANLRIFARSPDSSLPNIASVSTVFGFGRDLVQPNSYWIQEGEGLSWSYFPITSPLPEVLDKTFVQAQRERSATIWGQRSRINGPYADFGTLRLNFRTGSAEMTQPENEET